LRHLTRSVAVVLAAAALQSCATAETSFREKAIKGAAFQLSCPEEKLKLKVLKRQDGMTCEGSEIGVSGCGRLVRVIYVCDADGEWNLKKNDPAAGK